VNIENTGQFHQWLWSSDLQKQKS